jgi:ribosome-binding factor A
MWIIHNAHIDARMITLRVDEIILSKDLSRAKIKCYHHENLEHLINVLNKHRFALQKYICENLKIRRVPQIKFMSSPAISPQQEIERALNELAEA